MKVLNSWTTERKTLDGLCACFVLVVVVFVLFFFFLS